MAESLLALPERRFNGLVADSEFHMRVAELPVDAFDELTIRAEADTVLPAYQTKPADPAKERTVASVLLKVSTHQCGQRWHLIDKRQVHYPFRQFDQVPSATSRDEKRNAGWDARFTFYEHVRGQGLAVKVRVAKVFPHSVPSVRDFGRISRAAGCSTRLGPSRFGPSRLDGINFGPGARRHLQMRLGK